MAESIAQQLERRVSFRRAMKRAVQNAMRMGALGIRSTSLAVLAVPRLRGPNGIVKVACRCTRCAPTSTMPRMSAKTAYGIIGIKVWIFKGEIMEHDPAARDRASRNCKTVPHPVVPPWRVGGARINATAKAHQIPQDAQGPHQR